MTEEHVIPEETVPSIAQQAALLGWEYGIHSFGKAEQPNVDYFNSGLVERPDGIWLLTRRAKMDGAIPVGMNDIIAFKLDDAGTKPLRGTVLEWPKQDPEQQLEDPRAIFIPHMNQVAVSACTFKWLGIEERPSWTGPIQVLGFFDENWKCKVLHYPAFDTNGTELKVVPPEHAQKNWLWWHRNGKLHLLYKSEPWTVATFDNHWIDRRMVHVGNPLTWPYGTIRGGTPPIEIDGMLVTFFHSSTPWFDRWRRYHMGAIAFSPEPPFHPISMTMQPLISGTTAEYWGPRKPACIFPCGAVVRGDRVLVTVGINDMKSGWFDLPAASVMHRMDLTNPHPTIGDSRKKQDILDYGIRVFPNGDEVPRRKKSGKKRKPKQRTPEEQEKINARMAKARAARVRT